MGAVVFNRAEIGRKNQVIFGVDGGGTNFRVRAYPLHTVHSPEKTEVFETRLKTADYTKIGDVVRDILDRTKALKFSVKAMSFGLAGAFNGNKVRMTNRPEWEEVDLNQIAEEFGIPYVAGVNDLEATAYGIVSGLTDGDVYTLNQGKIVEEMDEKPTLSVIAPGTGLGESIIVWNRNIREYKPIPSEGGHSDFAPIDDLQDGLLQYLRTKHHEGAVCYEDVLSGDGLVDIWEYVTERYGLEKNLSIYNAANRNEKATLIAQYATDNNDQASRVALYTFIQVLAAEASNLGLKSLSKGGVYIGGTGTSNLKFIQDNIEPFMNVFTWKRKQRGLVQDMPVRVITKEDVNEYGAAYFVGRNVI